MAHKIIIVGIGPGSPRYMVPEALDTIKGAKVLVGSSRAMEQYGNPEGQKQFIIRADMAAVMEFIELHLPDNDVIVMVSGDPGYYSMLDAVRRSYSDECIKVIPGLSSMQVAFAKLGLPWHDADLISMHGRQPAPESLDFQPGRVIGFLTDKNNNSKTIPKMLQERGWPDSSMLGICSRLSYDDEEIIKTTLGDAAMVEKTFYNCVLVVVA
ncbi:MAG: precorrin-6y C5,15-methyltransferase (decarboxylating) subunit CbiE [Anaerovibrio sp.]|uniref:precorrin-6y C5,15-methyltransferase (decarboxylating) subunit CbiE n=1 Tax=Anaerovibrio sp. TaxID=1872532 RepID=UPI0025CCFA6A|nr:precorrin-6y C5,15-methyltransferase (decarboxylating) subunit CbiE [Anaerovibrio sp.]MCR5177258.1 precorrin-6y C5,15-methyltransferase (decarboxylating) subunit CbiE [Anaerovibrio sp.]